jgi:hypothetical protein
LIEKLKFKFLQIPLELLLQGLRGQRMVQQMLLNQLKAILVGTLAGPFQLDKIESLAPLVSAHLSSINFILNSNILIDSKQ